MTAPGSLTIKAPVVQESLSPVAGGAMVQASPAVPFPLFSIHDPLPMQNVATVLCPSSFFAYRVTIAMAKAFVMSRVIGIEMIPGLAIQNMILNQALNAACKLNDLAPLVWLWSQVPCYDLALELFTACLYSNRPVLLKMLLTLPSFGIYLNVKSQFSLDEYRLHVGSVLLRLNRIEHNEMIQALILDPMINSVTIGRLKPETVPKIMQLLFDSAPVSDDLAIELALSL